MTFSAAQRIHHTSPRSAGGQHLRARGDEQRVGATTRRRRRRLAARMSPADHQNLHGRREAQRLHQLKCRFWWQVQVGKPPPKLIRSFVVSEAVGLRSETRRTPRGQSRHATRDAGCTWQPRPANPKRLPGWATAARLEWGLCAVPVATVATGADRTPAQLTSTMGNRRCYVRGARHGCRMMWTPPLNCRLARVRSVNGSSV